MSADHASRSVWRPVRAVANLIATLGILLAGGWFLAAAGVSGTSADSPFMGFLWGSRDEGLLVSAWGAPAGQVLAGIVLTALGLVGTKVSPFVSRRREGIATFSWSPAHKREMRVALDRLREERAYPQRRVGRRSTIVAILALLVSAGCVPLFLEVRDTMVADGAGLRFGAQAAMVLAAVAALASLALVVLGLRAWLTAPSSATSAAASAAASAVPGVSAAVPPMPATPVPTPPMPGSGPSLPTPPPARS